MPASQKAAVGAAVLAAAAVFAVRTTPVELDPKASAWARVVRGAPGGLVAQHATVVIPGMERSFARRLRLVTAPGSADSVAVGLDGASVAPVRVPAEGLILTAPIAGAPGLRLDVAPLEGGRPAQLAGIEIEGGARAPIAAAGFAFALGFVVVLGLGRVLPPRLAGSLGLVTACAWALANMPALLLLSLPSAGGFIRLAVALLPAGLACATIASTPDSRRSFVRGTLVIAAFVFGTWVRGFFLPSTGSWDTDYWKAWTMRAVSHGVTRVYGTSEAVPAGHALAQARGDEELWTVEWSGKSFVVDQPPGVMLLWRMAYGAVSSLGLRLDSLETQNVAVKLPGLLGDLLAVTLLLLLLGDRPWTAVWCAAVYWAFPVSWLSSSVFGFFDNAYVAPLLAAVALAGRGRAIGAGVVFALAGLVKATGLMAAPALVVALLAARASVARAVVAGLSLIAVAVTPFALAGTLTTAVIHIYRIVFQERLSGGFANPWWLLGYVLRPGPGGWSGAVPYARLEMLPLPARPVGTALFALAVAFILWRQWGRRGQGPALLAAGAIAMAYGMLAIGVQVNHPHAFFLLLLATGLPSWRSKTVCLGAGAVYVLNMLLLEALGRFHGPRYSLLEPLNHWLAGWRMGLGFDATLLLVPVNLAFFVLLLVSLRDEMKALEDK